MDERGPILRWLANVYGDLTDGQRWTIGLVLAVSVAFVGFGLRQAPGASSFDLKPVTLPGASNATSQPSAQTRPAPSEQPLASTEPGPGPGPGPGPAAIPADPPYTPSADTTTTSTSTTTTTSTTAPPAITVPSLP